MSEIDYINIKKLKEGSRQAFEQLFKSHYPSLYRLAYGLLMNREQAEDVVQDVFVAVWETRSTLSEQIPIHHYLYTCVKYSCYDIFKHLKVIDKNSDKLAEALFFAGMMEYEDNEHRIDEILSIIELLPEQQRQALKLKLVDDMSYREISESMGISEGTVHTHIKRAYGFIRKTSLIIAILTKSLFLN